MRLIISILLAGIIPLVAKSQSAGFPKSWEGNWKGELQWFKTGQTAPRKVQMELRIHPTDSSNTWSWQIIYGGAAEDNRPYTLISKDSTGTHWVIDEHNGIVLDQYWVGEKFCGAFTVMNNTILNSYWMDNGNLVVEFFSTGAQPLTTSGSGTDESPLVYSYRVGSYQKAILQRSK